MPRYEISSPDGRKFEVTAPEGASQAEVLAYAQANFGAPPKETTVGGNVKEFFKGIVPGAVGLAESAAVGASALLPEETERAARERIKSVAAAAKAPFAAAPGYEETIPRKFGEAVGSTIPFLAAGPFGVAGRIAGTALGVGAGAGTARSGAEAGGADEGGRGLATGLGALVGTAEMFAPIRILGRLADPIKQGAVAQIKRALIAGGEEGAQEAASQIAQNLIAKGIYKPEQAIIEQVGESAAYGGATGALLQGLLDMAIGRRGASARAPTTQVPGAPPDKEVAAQAARVQRQQEQRLAAQGISSREGEKILDAEAAEQAKIAKAEEAAAQQTMKEDYAQRRAEREAELKEAFPADYSDVMERTNRYGVLATELASLTGVRKTPEVKGRIRALQARMADVAAEDDRIPNEFLRMQRDQVAATRAAGFPAKKSAAVLGGAFPAQMEMREALAPVELPPQTDLFGKPLLPTTPQPEGLATVAEAELPLTSEVLRDAGIAPTTKELEAAGQQRLPLRKTPAGQPTSPLRPATPVATEVVAPLPEVAIESAAPAQPGAITPSEIKQFGTMSKANRSWLVDNIEGRTPEQVRDMVEADPTIMTSVPKGLQTVLKEIVATAAPKETPSVQPTTAPIPEAEPQLRARRGKPSMAVPSEPAVTEPVVAPTAEPTRAQEPTPPVGLGLAPAGQPVGERAAPEVAGKPALDEEETQRKAEAQAVIEALANVRKAAQAVKAKAPAPAPAPAPKPVKAAPKEEAPAPAPTGSPFDILSRNAAVLKARAEEKAAPAKAEAAPAKAETAPAKPEKLYDRLDLPQGPARENAKNEEIPLEDAKLLKRMIVKTVDAGLASGKTRQQIADQLDALTKGGITPTDFSRINDYLTEKGVKEEAPTVKPAPAIRTGLASTSEAVEPGQSIGSLRGEILRGKGVLASALRRAIASGKVVLETRHPDGGIGGYFDGEKVTLYAEGIPAGQAMAVALHEVGAHMGFKNLFGDRVYSNIIKQIQELATSKVDSADRTLAKAAMNRIPESDKARGVDVYGDETLAYFIEEAVKAQNAGTLATSGPVRALFNNIRLAMLAAINRVFGSKLGVADLTTEDILSMAKGAFVRESFSAVKERAIPDAGRASVSAAKTLGVDALDAGMQDSIEAIQAAIPKLEANARDGVISQAVQGVADARKKSGVLTTFRQAALDKFSTVESKVSQMFSQGVRDSFGNLNPMVLARQAEDSAKIVLDFFRTGGIKLSKEGLVTTTVEKQSMASALTKVAALGEASGMSYDKAKEHVSTVLEGHRLDSIRKHNNMLEQEAVSMEALGRNREADAKRDEKIRMHMSNADINTLEAIYQKSKAIQSIQDDLNATRTQAIDFMVSTGRISAEQGDFWKDNTAYVPFSRVFEDAPISKVRRGQGMAVLRNIPEMKGSLGRPVENVLDAYANRLGYMAEESMKNHAAVNLLDTMTLGGYAKKLVGPEQATNKNLVVPKLYIDGKPAYFEVQNEYDLLAFQQAPEITNWLVKSLSSTSRVLRTSVTAMPPFALKQVIDDAQRAMLLSGVKRPLAVGMKTLYNLPRTFFGELTGRKSPLVRQMEALGVIGDFDSNIYKPTSDLETEIGAKKRGVGKSILHRLEQFTKASDLAARLAVYEETLLETGGKKQEDGDITGGDTVLAQTRSRELINFSRKGTSGSMRLATQVIPFFNAYAQGLDVLYRAASGIDSTSSVERGAARKLFWSRVGLMTAMGFAYAMAMSDDEGYKNASEDVRDNNWLLPNGAKLPVPKELGFIFKTIPERIVDYSLRSGTAEEQDIMKALGGVVKSAYSAYASPTAIPSFVRPILENMTNYSFFLQRELEPKSVQGQEPGFRSTSGTSELAKALGEQINFSPIKIDNLLRGMFGMAGSTTLLVTDALVNPTRPDRPLYQLPFASIFLYDTIGGKAKTEFYELREKVGMAVTTYNDLKDKNPEKAEAYGEKNANLLSVAPTINQYLKQLNDLGRLRRLLEQGTEEMLGMTGEERRKEIDEIRKAENEAVSFVREMETELRKKD